MEFIKQSEQYKIVDSLENGWTVEGTVTKSRDLNVWASVNSESNGQVGYINYTKPETGHVSLSYNVAEDTRDEFAEYVNTLVDTVLEHFNTQTL